LVSAHNFLRDAETHACTGYPLPMFSPPVKPLENLSLFLFGNSRPTVLDADDHYTLFRARADGEGTVRRRVLQGIV
jgi:hypothetical protein